MSSRKAVPWWLSKPALITASVAALGAAGTAVVKLADYIRLPEAVAQQEQRNDTQDQRLDKLITLQEYYQQQQQVPNQPAQRPTYRYWTDDDGNCWRCDVRWDCEQDQSWEVCE